MSQVDIVTLITNPEEGWAEEKAKYIAYEGNDTHLVCLLPEFRTDLRDDGIREVTTEQIRGFLE